MSNSERILSDGRQIAALPSATQEVWNPLIVTPIFEGCLPESEYNTL